MAFKMGFGFSLMVPFSNKMHLCWQLENSLIKLTNFLLQLIIFSICEDVRL